MLLPTSAISITLLALACAALPARAQQLPQPSRLIYKCQLDGKTSYSDKPCMGARRLDIVVPRGMDRLSGSTRTGADVQHEVYREGLANALKPLSGMTPDEFAIATRRQGLSTEAQRHCHGLDAALPTAEQAEQRATPATVDEARVHLFTLRKQFHDLGC